MSGDEAIPLAERIRAAVTYQTMPMSVRRLLSEADAALSRHPDTVTIEQASISLIVDLCGAGASQSSTNLRVVEDHLRQFARAAATPSQRLDAATAEREARAVFRKAARGHGRAGTAELPDGPYMSMDDAAEVYARLVANSPKGLDAATVERCAQVAEAYYSGHGVSFGSQRAHNYEHAGRRLAERIRALATDPHQHGADNGGEA